METSAKVAYLFIDVLLPLSLGYLFHQRHWLSEKACNQIVVINILVFSTILSILSFWSLPLERELIWLPLFGILLSFIPGFAAYWTAEHKYDSGLEKGSYLASAILSNIGTLGGLCAYFLFGEPGFAYTQIVALFQNLVLLLFCFPMAQYYLRQSQSSGGGAPAVTFSSLFLNRNQLPVLGLAAGLALCIGGVPRPAFFGEIFHPLVHLSTWTALFPAGYSINFLAMRQYYHSTLDLIPIKFLVTPLVGYFIARQLFQDSVILGTILVAACVPTGINAIITARLYKLNLHVSGAAFVLTTVIFLFIVYPILFLWLTPPS